MEVLDRKHDGPAGAAGDGQGAERLEGVAAPGLGGHPADRGVVRLRAEEAQEEGDSAGIRTEGPEAPLHLVANGFVPIALDDSEAAPEELDDGQERNGLAVGDAAALEVENVVAEATAELEEDSRLPDASFTHDSDDLAATLADPFQRLTEVRQLSLAAHERRQLGREIHATSPLPEARHLVSDDERLLALDRKGRQGPEGERPGRESTRRLADQDDAGLARLLEARRKVDGVALSRVVHPEVVADLAHDDRAAVEADAHAELDALLSCQGGAVPRHGRLDGQGGVDRPFRVILVGDRRTKQRHDAVTRELVDRALRTDARPPRVARSTRPSSRGGPRGRAGLRGE